MSKKFDYKITINDLVGNVGYWEIIKELEPTFKNGRYTRKIQCKCVCGKIKEVLFTHLRHKKSTSCGCIVLHTKTHGLTKTDLYGVWQSMKARCYNKKRERYKDWGGRGIIICDLWKKDFLTFYNWCINNNYSKGLQIDRIDNNGNYEPNNCRFVTPQINSLNRRKND